MVTPAKSAPAAKSSNAPLTEGLSELDRDRAASVADEGGASAATVEFQRPGREAAKIADQASAAQAATTHIRRPDFDRAKR